MTRSTGELAPAEGGQVLVVSDVLTVGRASPEDGSHTSDWKLHQKDDGEHRAKVAGNGGNIYKNKNHPYDDYWRNDDGE